MKIKITLMLIVVSLLAYSPLVASMPSPEEQEQAMLYVMQLLEKNPQLAEKIKGNMRKAMELQLGQLSPEQIKGEIEAMPYEAFVSHLNLNKHNNTNLQAHITKNLLALTRKEQVKILARAKTDQALSTLGMFPLAMQFLQEHGGAGMPSEDDEATAPDQEPKPKELPMPDDHVIILPVKKAEAFAKDLEQQLRATKGFAQSYAMLLPNLSMNVWNKGFEEEEKWLKSLQEQIEKAKKKPAETAVLGGVSADFEAALEQDCQSAGLVPLITAMELHIMKSNGQSLQGAPSIESCFDKLPTSEQEKERLEKHRKSTAGKVALIRASIPKKINNLLPTSDVSKSPFLEYAKIIAAARKITTKPTPAT